jgi:hypothetical protein
MTKPRTALSDATRDLVGGGHAKHFCALLDTTSCRIAAQIIYLYDFIPSLHKDHLTWLQGLYGAPILLQSTVAEQKKSHVI